MDFLRHDRNNHWCKFPKMKCVCTDSDPMVAYERLGDAEDKDSSNEKEEKITIFNDDGNSHSVIVEKNLCSSDLCQLLALKNAVAKSASWSIVEHWIDLGLERLIEDHEYVLSAYRDMKNYSRNAKYKYVFRNCFKKYDFFTFPQEYFPSDMLDIENEDITNTSPAKSIEKMVMEDGQSPVIFSHVWIKDEERHSWMKGFLLLRDKKLYLSYKLEVIGKFLRMSRIHEQMISESDVNGLTVFARLTDYHVYTTLNAKNHFKAPTEWGICLRPTASEPDTEEVADLRCLACTSEQARTCWLTAMRLAKYGKQLRENYRAFKNKQADSINPKDYNSYTVPNESVRSRVAMDFTGSVGRIVEDPKEAKAIATAEGYSWKRRWRTPCRASPALIQGLETGIHITQPWFHSGMSRDQATALVTRHGTVDGVFLVRDSRSHQGAFVLTYKCGSKVLHAQITPILDPVKEAHVFSLDNGVTKFYDLLQLVEFYQLNAGCLPTRLTHYVVQNVSPVHTPTGSSAT